MYNVLRLEGDPASWILYDATIEALARRLNESGDPVALQVVDPLQGRLVLSPRCAGSVALLAPPGGVGWVPGHIMLPAAHLYVASVTGPTQDFPGYALASSVDLDGLERKIMAAMDEGTVITVEVSDGTESGVLMLNGAALPLVVLCPPSTPAPGGSTPPAAG
jgi:hypothetical protein